MRILITGCNGMLGQKLTYTFASHRYELHGVDLAPQPEIDNIPFRYRQLDLVNRRLTLETIRSIEPEAIIHTAAVTDVDGCERDKENCWKVNVNATQNVLDAARAVSSRLFFISSDYVFDGTAGPYDEEDQPNPINYYGKSKLAAENLIRGGGTLWTIIRTIVLYGCGRKTRASFVSWLLGQLRAGKPVRIVDDQWGNTTLADNLAEAIERALILNKTGIFNIGGVDFVSRYEFSVEVARFFDLDVSLIKPIKTAELGQLAPRPLKSGLKIEKAQHELYIALHDIRESLRIYRDQEAQMRCG